MRIAILGIRGVPASYGGFETCAEATSKHWAGNGHEVIIYCRANIYRNRPVLLDGCRMVYLPTVSSKSFETMIHSLLSVMHLLLKNRNVEIVHMYNSGNALFLPLLKLAGKHVAITIDGLEWKRKKWGLLAKSVHLLGEKLATMFADIMIADNQVVANYYAARYRNVRMKMIPYGAKIAQCDDKTCADEVLGRHGLEKQKYLIFVGRLVPEKGIHNLIEAYNSINLAMPLVIVGDDRNDSEYRNTLMKQKSDRIRFLGFIYGKEYEYLLCNALLYVSASELEGTSPSLLAAMGAGVCAVVNGIEENLCTVGDAAFSYRANDNSDLAKTLEQLVNNPDSIHRMAKKGLELVRKKYAWSSVAEAYLNVFSGLIKDS